MAQIVLEITIETSNNPTPKPIIRKYTIVHLNRFQTGRQAVSRSDEIDTFQFDWIMHGPEPRDSNSDSVSKYIYIYITPCDLAVYRHKIETVRVAAITNTTWIGRTDVVLQRCRMGGSSSEPESSDLLCSLLEEGRPRPLHLCNTEVMAPPLPAWVIPYRVTTPSVFFF